MAMRKLLEATRSLSRRVQSACRTDHCPGCRNASGTASTSREGSTVQETGKILLYRWFGVCSWSDKSTCYIISRLS